MMLLSRPCFVDSPPPRLPSSCAFSSSQSLQSLSLWRLRPPRHHLRLTNNIYTISCNSSSNSNNHIISRNSKQQTRLPPPLAPQLLLSSLSNPEYRYLYDLTLTKKGKGKEEDEEEVQVGIKLNRELYLPDISKRIFIGSSQGFLISIDMFRSPTIHAFNPLTGAHLHIPHLPPPPPTPRRPNNFRLRKFI